MYQTNAEDSHLGELPLGKQLDQHARSEMIKRVTQPNNQHYHEAKSKLDALKQLASFTKSK